MKSPEISVDKARLLSAAAVIREHGWMPGVHGGQKVCLMQALAIADGRSPACWFRSKAPKALVDLVRPFVPANNYYINERGMEHRIVAHYNDSYCDGGEQAIAILEEAAARS